MVAVSMARDTRFWTLLLVFQVFFGLAVFAVTREYYRSDAPTISGHPPVPGPAPTAWSQGITGADISRLTSPPPGDPALRDPAEISRLADEAFSNKDYATAARLYEQLLGFNPDNVEIYNNLGLTLFYLDRVDEALQRLNEGVAADAQYQRIWLTLGFVNAHLGNTDEARTALTKAVQIGDNESIRESAAKMLAQLP